MFVRLSRWCIRAAGFAMVAALAWCQLTRVAVAQPQPSQAEVLFQRGLEKMRQGDYATACPELAASYELEPLPGALFTLAECEASWGKVATALTHYQQFVATLPSLLPPRRQKFEERRRLALEQIASLGPTVPLLSINVAAGAPPDLVVKRDDTIVSESSYGVETPVDPGELVITAAHGGKTVWQRRVRVSTRDRANIVVPWPIQTTLGAVPSGGAAPQKERVPDVQSHEERRSNGTHPRATVTRNPLTTWKYVAAGIGAAGLTVSLVAGAIALGKKGTVDDECDGSYCSQHGFSEANSAKQAARVSTVGFIVGVSGAAAFTGLWLFGGDKPEQARASSARVMVHPMVNGGALRLEGSF